MENEYAWPRPGMSLFDTADRGDWRPNANMSWGPNWTLYQNGYAEAAQLLMRHTASGKDQDFLIYPILFTARQAIELGLKEIILRGNRLLGREDPYPNSHDLCRPWKMAKTLLADAEAIHQPGASDGQATTAFEELIKQLSAADPKSMTFRYPVDTKGRPSFVVGSSNGKVPQLINTRDLNHTLSAMFNYLTAAGAWLENILETIEDLHTDFSPDYEW